MNWASSLSGEPYLLVDWPVLLLLWPRTRWRWQKPGWSFKTAGSPHTSAWLTPCQRSTRTRGCSPSTGDFPSLSWVRIHVAANKFVFSGSCKMLHKNLTSRNSTFTLSFMSLQVQFPFLSDVTQFTWTWTSCGRSLLFASLPCRT